MPVMSAYLPINRYESSRDGNLTVCGRILLIETACEPARIDPSPLLQTQQPQL